MSTEANKAAVRRYFSEVLDGGHFEVLHEIMADGAPMHFPGREMTAQLGATARRNASSFKTEIHHLVAEDDLVVAHITHWVTYEAGAKTALRHLSMDVGGKTITWDAMAMFRFVDGKIAEEWVNRDELYQAIQGGAVTT